MSGRNRRGEHAAQRSNGRRSAIVVGVIAIVLVALGGGYLLASDGDGDDGAASAQPTASRTPEPSSTEAPTATTTQTPTTSPTAAPSADPNILENGRHFVFLNGAKVQGGSTLTFDLAEFYQGQEAIDVAADRGDEVTNDYYIVNDNPRLRTMPVAEGVTVRYIPEGTCCGLQTGTFDAFADAVNGTAQTDYFVQAPWWITVSDGTIVRIQQQYLP